MCFEKLVSNRGVVIGDIGRSNRLLFVNNMREFMTEIKAFNLQR